MLAVYGHYGHPELALPWEKTDKTDALIQEAKAVAGVRW
jgi:S-adenosylmethionine synthetase